MPRLRRLLKIPGKITNHDLRERWGVSVGPIYRMIAQGTLVVSDRINGCVYYNLSDIEVIEEAGLRPIPMSKNMTPLGGKTSKARRKPYNRDMSFLYAEAFRMFREKATLKDVVTALQLTPQQVDQMYAEYMQPDLDERQKNRDVYRIIRVV